MKYFFLLLLFSFLFLGPQGVNAQAFQGFENRATDVDCTSTDCRYTDADQTAHELMDMTNSFGRFIPVNDVSIVDPAGPDQLGFKTFFAPTGSGTGFSDGDVFGFAKGGAITGSFGPGAFEGNQIFFLEDVDGEVTLEFSPVRLAPGATGNFTMQYIYSGSFDVGTPNDRLNISLEVTGCSAATTLVLLNADGAAPPGTIDQWNGLSQSLNPYGGCDVQLIIKADVNTTSEEIGFDAVNFPAGTALPVEFIDIAANQRKDAVLLDWSTATETDNRGFTVERSLDGRSFAPVGWVDGVGEAQAQVNYEFEDKNVRAGQEYYYRLRQEDYDGAFAYSSIVKVKVVGTASTEAVGQFFPNPAVAGQSNIELYPTEAGDWTLSVVDLNGRVLETTKHTLGAGYNLVPVDLAKHPAGAYLIRIAGKEQTVYRKVVR